MITILFYLICGHALCDFPLQSAAIAVEKNPNSTSELQKHVPWYYWLSSHALIHGAAVSLITGSVILGIAETVAHWFIDLGKCNKLYSIHSDQVLHILCKIIWMLCWMISANHSVV